MKKKNIFLGLLIAASLLLAIGCDMGGGGSTSAVTYAIGDPGPSGVGIVFYVTDGGLHGLEVAPVDQSTGAAWITGGDTQTTANGNTSTDIGTGSANTDAIIAQTGHTASAAQICRDYRAAEEGDWFLPSQYELNAIWDNLVDDGTGANSGVGGFSGFVGIYWSSSEYDSDNALYQYFYDGAQGYRSKDYGPGDDYGRVRAVRAF